MSDMSRPATFPPAADHERHDALLVAQLVAGDPLPPEQRTAAEHLVARCAACAALAADLPLVSRAVAQEPVPTRRRDFRLSPEQAEQLRGSALTRFLRRLSLPSSRAFQPAAAGVLSIGLLFVVAGYAWPDGGTITVQAEPNFVDWSSAAPASLPNDAAEALADRVEVPPAPGTAESDLDDAAALDGAARLMEESEFAESLAESQAGMSEGLTQKARDAEAPAVPDADAGTAPEADALGSDTAAYAAVESADEMLDDEAAELSARANVPDITAPAEGAAESLVAVASDGPLGGDDDGLEDLLIIIGLVLALGGGGLLLLGWLARRARDPLAP